MRPDIRICWSHFWKYLEQFVDLLLQFEELYGQRRAVCLRYGLYLDNLIDFPELLYFPGDLVL